MATVEIGNSGSGGVSIGSALGSGTAGRVLFEGSGPVLADDAGMTYDATNNALTVDRFYAALSGALTPGPGYSFQGFGFTGMYSPGSNILALASGGDPRLAILAGSTFLAQTTELSWCTATFFSASTTLLQESLGVMGQRSSTNPTGYNWYNTYTDASNYERGYVKWSSNALKIGTEAAGTGSNRGLILAPGNGQVAVTGKLNVNVSDPSSVGTTIKAAPVQTANLQEWQDSSGATMAAVDINGRFVGGYVGTSPINVVSMLFINDGTISFAGGGTGNGWVITGSNGTVLLACKGTAAQTANLQEWQNSSGTALAAITKNGGVSPASMADASASNNTLYYSTDANKLVYKDAGGVVNNLY